jgi:hypothetical protein
MIPQYAGNACLAEMSPDPEYLAALDPRRTRRRWLARIRQLAAHETGHTLGFGHNFAASSYGRASVMDYPAPWVDIKDGKLDLSNAYATGIGEFDKWSVKYAYSQFPPAPTRRSSSRRSSRTACRAACSTSRTRTAGRSARAPAGEPVGQRRRRGGHAQT